MIVWYSPLQMLILWSYSSCNLHLESEECALLCWPRSKPVIISFIHLLSEMRRDTRLQFLQCPVPGTSHRYRGLSLHCSTGIKTCRCSPSSSVQWWPQTLTHSHHAHLQSLRSTPGQHTQERSQENLEWFTGGRQTKWSDRAAFSHREESEDRVSLQQHDALHGSQVPASDSSLSSLLHHISPLPALPPQQSLLQTDGCHGWPVQTIQHLITNIIIIININIIIITIQQYLSTSGPQHSGERRRYWCCFIRWRWSHHSYWAGSVITNTSQRSGSTHPWLWRLRCLVWIRENIWINSFKSNSLQLDTTAWCSHGSVS